MAIPLTGYDSDKAAVDQALRRTGNEFQAIATDTRNGITQLAGFSGGSRTLIRAARGAEIHDGAVDAQRAANRMEEPGVREAADGVGPTANELDS